MPYKVLINRCNDGQRALAIAAEIARWSGNKRDTVYRVLIEKTICIKQNADFDEAQKLRTRFERIGATVELFNTAPSPSPAYSDDDDEDIPGRILSDEEYCNKVKKRDDIFYLDTNRRLRNTEAASLCLGLLFGVYLSTHQPEAIDVDFFETPPPSIESVVKVVDPVDIPRPEPKVDKPKEVKISVSQKRSLKQNAHRGAGGKTGGGGDPRARVAEKGLLGIINGKIKGTTVASADPFGKGGFTENIDAILSGLGGLKAGGDGGVGRRGVAGIGYGKGYESGFGGGIGDVANLIDNIFGNESVALDIRKRGPREIRISKPDGIGGGALVGGRSKASIARVVQQNLAALRYAYNQRLRDKPGLKGRITVRFAIDEFGNVLFCRLNDSTMKDATMEALVVKKIKLWKFDKIDKVGDVTEVVYPFVFNM